MGIFSRLFGSGAAGGGEPVRDVGGLVAPLCSPALALIAGSGARSHIGGAPRVPAGFAWPRRDARALSFLAQLDLAELAAAGGPNWLPGAGSLAFFYDALGEDGNGGPWGFDPKDFGGWSVVYLEEGAAAGEAAPPADLPAEAVWKRKEVGARCILVPPSWERPGIQALGLSEAEEDALSTLHDGLFEGGPHHQVGGWPDPVQGDDMEEQCQLASNGIYLGGDRGGLPARAEALKAGAADWRLLLQLDSDDDAGFMWGDVGMLYFWIREEDARALRFDKAWMVLQCC